MAIPQYWNDVTNQFEDSPFPKQEFAARVVVNTEHISAVLEAERAINKMIELGLVKSSYHVVLNSCLNSAMRAATHPKK